MDGKITVLQFIPSISAKDGGTTTYMRELTPSLGRLVNLHVCALGNIEDFVPLPNANVHAIELRLTHICRMRKQWIEVLDEVNPDIVHINCCWMPQCALVQYWTRRHVPVKSCHKPQILLTPHGMLEPWIIKRNYWTKKVPAILLYQKWAVSDADVIVSTAEEERKHILQLGWNSNVKMLPNGIDTSSIEVKSHWKVARDLLFMSRLHPKKGLEMLIEAMSDTDHLRLKIAGEGETAYVQSLLNLVNDLGLGGKIEFVGPVYCEEKWKMVRDADVVVLPSYSENFGLIVAEALASGTPVLTTTGTPWQAIESNDCGWWVEPNVEAIKNALKAIRKASSDELRMKGRRGRTLIEKDFDIEKLANSLYEIYSNDKKSGF